MERFDFSIMRTLTNYKKLYFQDNEEECLSFLGALWISFASVFGITVIDAHQFKRNISKRMLLSLFFLMGNIMYYAYQAKLTSTLAVPIFNLPFQSPEELLKTDYRFLRQKKVIAF